MSNGWSLWVMCLVVFNMSITLFLFLWAPHAKIPTLPDGTSGHVWAHGVLREGVRKLPTWWIVFSASMFVAGFIYLFLFPGFGNHKGYLGWTSHGQLVRETATNDARLDAAFQRFDKYTIEQLSGDREALAMGEVLFRDNCAACHGRNAHGNPLLGAPNLTDNDWLYGGEPATIKATITEGRNGVMPAWRTRLGEDRARVVAAWVYAQSQPGLRAAR